jgi:hypothetical protein
MDEIITNIVHISLAGVCCEVLYRISSAAIVTTKENGDPYWFEGGFIFLISYVLCIITQLSGFKDITYISKSESFRSLLSILHGLDGFAALLIGVSLYYKSKIGLWLSLIMITKIFLIHLLNRLILAKKSDLGILAECTQTTKSYLHHVSSFLFISHPTEIIITTLWRTISMTGRINIYISIFDIFMPDYHCNSRTLCTVLIIIQETYLCILCECVWIMDFITPLL